MEQEQLAEIIDFKMLGVSDRWASQTSGLHLEIPAFAITTSTLSMLYGEDREAGDCRNGGGYGEDSVGDGCDVGGRVAREGVQRDGGGVVRAADESDNYVVGAREGDLCDA